MKKAVLVLLVLSVYCVGLQSCKKKDNKEKTENSLKVNGNKFTPNHRTSIEGKYENKGKGELTINLWEISENNKEIKQIIICTEYLEKDNIEGKYYFPKKDGEKVIIKNKTFFKEFNNNNSDTQSNISSGEVSISHNGDKDNYTISINIKTDDGHHIKGTYSNNFSVLLN